MASVRPGRYKNLFEDLQAISLRSAEELQGHEKLTGTDLYDAYGLPA